ncbi:MAG: hypothetical protein ACRC1W_12860 [Shewanella sp.]
MNEVTMNADNLLDMVSKFHFDAKSGKEWEDLLFSIEDIIGKANRMQAQIILRMR